MIEKKTAEDNLNYANNKLVALSKSRITQLMQLKEEAISEGDNEPSGADKTKFSLQPSYFDPPKCLSVNSIFCSEVPVAPSNTRTGLFSEYKQFRKLELWNFDFKF